MTEACSESSLIYLAKPDSTSLFGGESITVWRTRSILNADALRLTRRFFLAVAGLCPVQGISGINITSAPPATAECGAIHQRRGLSDPLRLAISTLMQDQMSDLPCIVFHKGNLGINGCQEELRIGLGEQLDWLLPGSLRPQAVAFPADCQDEGRREFIPSDVSVVDFRIELDRDR